MPLNIVVCVKSTPTTTNVSVDPATGRIKSAGLVYDLNPYDEYAVEEAVLLKERVPGSTATALTVGPPSAEAVLRKTVTYGIDAGVLASAPEIEGLASYGTSFVLSCAIKKLNAQKPVHVVLFGKNSNDGNSGTVGAMTAAWLEWPSITSVKKIESIDEKTAVVWRMLEDGVDVLRAALPAALCTVKEINNPRIPSLKNKMASKKAVFPSWGLSELGLRPEHVGEALAGTRIARYNTPPQRPAGMRLEGTSAAEKAQKLVDALVERKLI